MEPRAIRQSVSLMLAQALTLAEIRYLPNLRDAQLLTCTTKGFSIKPLTEDCTPDLAEMDIPAFDENTVRRHVTLKGHVASLDAQRLHAFECGCMLVAYAVPRVWAPFHLWLKVNYLGSVDKRSNLVVLEKFYHNGTYEGMPVTRNAFDSCLEFGIMQVLPMVHQGVELMSD